ncbi:hypothetical protein RHSIM_Rhsim01G0046700 [Rhododendron simsii]|uniref:Uncharacterized protein n=1 Tax=Rhododendron simsii TaxID=118357 RepID=A0A834HJE7_RHOSS|nr:hypothetical protein RHSIM_Rhsim01G0046700 [Rhododendron simsii]
MGFGEDGGERGLPNIQQTVGKWKWNDLPKTIEKDYHTVVLFFVSGLVAASDQWSARRGFGAALDRQRLPCQNSACQREFALWSGVLTGELFEFLLLGLATD